MSSPIHIVFACDRAYLAGAAGLVKSILLSARNASSLHFHFLDLGESLESHDFLGTLIHPHGAHLSRHAVRSQTLEGLALMRYLSLATYARLLIPRMLDDSIGYALYLDVDVIVRAPIEELFDACDKTRALSACTDMCIPTLGSPLGVSYWRELGIDPSGKYLNAGVLGMNLDLWREQSLSERMLSHAREFAERLEFADQESINAVIQGDWHDLGYEWNQQAVFLEQDRLSMQPRYGEIVRANARAKVIHFTYPIKPWDVRCKDVRKAEYLTIFQACNAGHLIHRPRLNRLLGDRFAARLRSVRMKCKLYRKL